MNKKAVSAVVATVLIILITIAAVTIIWSAIIPMIQNKISGSGDCLDASGQISLNEETTCINITGSFVKVGVQRAQGTFKLDSVAVKLYLADGSSLSADDTSVTTLVANTEKVINLTNVSFNNLSVDLFKGATKVNLAPKIKTGTTVQECGLVREATLKSCT